MNQPGWEGRLPWPQHKAGSRGSSSQGSRTWGSAHTSGAAVRLRGLPCVVATGFVVMCFIASGPCQSQKGGLARRENALHSPGRGGPARVVEGSGSGSQLVSDGVPGLFQAQLSSAHTLSGSPSCQTLFSHVPSSSPELWARGLALSPRRPLTVLAHLQDLCPSWSPCPEGSPPLAPCTGSCHSVSA